MLLRLQLDIRIKTIYTMKMEPKGLAHHKMSDTWKLITVTHLPLLAPLSSSALAAIRSILEAFKLAKFWAPAQSNYWEQCLGDSRMQPGLRASGSRLTINVLLLYEQRRYKNKSLPRSGLIAPKLWRWPPGTTWGKDISERSAISLLPRNLKWRMCVYHFSQTLF